jgi:hypothetical protein
VGLPGIVQHQWCNDLVEIEKRCERLIE